MPRRLQSWRSMASKSAHTSSTLSCSSSASCRGTQSGLSSKALGSTSSSQGSWKLTLLRPLMRLLRAQTRQKPDRTRTDRAGRCLPCRARRIPSGQAALPKQLGDALQYNPPPAPCYMCYMCYMAPNPLSPGSLLYVLYVLYLTRQPTEHPLSPGSLLYVLYVLYLTRQPTEHPLFAQPVGFPQDPKKELIRLRELP